MILKILLVIIGVFLGLVGSGFCQSAKARDTITMTLEDYEHMGEILHSLPIRERHATLKGKDVALYRCPKCKSYVAEWTEVTGRSWDCHTRCDGYIFRSFWYLSGK